MQPTDVPCEPWPIDTECWNLPEGDHSALIAKWQLFASTILWRLSGRRWGTCEVPVRPCLRRCLDDFGSYYGPNGGLYPYISRGRWYNAVTCGCAADCACGELCEVRLPGPVNSIVSVQIDGVELNEFEYRVDASSNLVRQGDGCWPDCQDMAAPDGEDGTFSVTYLRGLPVDETAIQAVSAYTEQLVRSCLPGCDCELPSRVTQITRNNVSASFDDFSDFLDNGRTGIRVVDDWLRTVNPENLQAPPRVLSPDYRPPRRTIWQAGS